MIARGARLGTYEVLDRIGGGGTGEVFRGRDARLGRDVALKILSGPFKLDARHRVLFEREARLLASLNHPNIATLHGIEDTGDAQALVLELVEGDTLAERVADGPIPLAQALEIAQQIAAALEAAHERGIVHRDLKPDNIKVRVDGTVKVLDFGIASVLHPIAERGEVPSATFTLIDGLQGKIVGTPSYMSPEQTRGLPVDERADIWSFGCVLYEMLTARRAFPGETAFDRIAAILDREPDWSALPQDCPPFVARLLRRCLEKDRSRRLRHIGDARADLIDGAYDRLTEQVRSAFVRRPFAFRLPIGMTRLRSRSVMMLFALAGLVLAPALFWYVSTGRDAALGEAAAASGAAGANRIVARQANSIAVLPFNSLSVDIDDAFFAAGLHEEILSRLARLPSLNVISRTSVLRYAGTQSSIPEIAEELGGVEAVVEGSVRYAGNQLLVTAQLIDADTDSQLWSATFRADRSNVEQIFAIQADIASAIANALGTEISADEQRRIPTHSAAAYARYLRALNYCRDRQFAESIRELNAAIALDAEFAEAYALRAYIYAFAQITSGARIALLADGRSKDENFEALALAEAARALELDEQAGLAWTARAVTHAFHFRMRDARDAFRRAVAVTPNDPDILVQYATFEAYFGSIDEALALVGRAARLDPAGALTWGNVASVQMAAGLVNEANASLAKALSFDPANPDAYVFAGLFNPDPEAAERFIRTGDDLDSRIHLMGIALGYQRLGLDDDAERTLDRYEQWAKSEQGSAGAAEWAQYYLLSGNLDAAHASLKTAVETLENGEVDEGFFALQYTFATPTHPALTEPRFEELLQRLERLRRSN